MDFVNDGGSRMIKSYCTAATFLAGQQVEHVGLAPFDAASRLLRAALRAAAAVGIRADLNGQRPTSAPAFAHAIANAPWFVKQSSTRRPAATCAT